MMLLFALVILAIAGLGLFSWVHPKRPLNLFETVGASLFLGSVFISGSLFGLGPFLRGYALVGGIAFLGLTLASCGFWRLRRAQWETLPGARTFAVILLAAILIVAWQAFARPLGADGVFNFEVRARLAWENGGAIPREFFSDPSRNLLHASYPLFVPLNQLWIYLCLGEPHQSLVKVLGVIWFAAAACLTFSQLTRATRSPVPGFLFLAFLFVVPMFVLYPGGAAWVWADFPVSAMAIAALLYLAEYRTDRTGLGAFSLMLAALPWIKREGLILGCLLLAIVALDAFRKRDWRALAIAAPPFLFVVAGWSVFTTAMGAPPVGDFMTPSPALFWQNLEQLPRVIAIAIRELLVWQRWALLWPVAALAWIRIARDSSLSRWRFAVSVNVALIVIYTSVYVFSAWPVLPWHMLTSFPRLLLAPAMIAIVLVSVAVPRRQRDPVEAGSPEMTTESST